MVLAKIAPESQWTLTSTHGVGDGAVIPGTVVTVQAVCPPGTPGVGDDGTDTVLASWVEGSAEDPVARMIAIPVAEFEAKFQAKGKSRAR